MASFSSGGRRLGRVSRAAFDVLLPPRCLACGEIVAEPGTLCAGCWPHLAFLGPPMCACCGYPFDHDTGTGALCGACLRAPPVFDRARSVLRYDDHSRELVIAFKHRDRTDAARGYARWMARAGADVLADAELLVPVPLHRLRLLARRYNQSAELARALVRETGVLCAPDLLARTRRTPSQGRMSATQRRRNVQGAFAVRGAWRDRVAGRSVVLIDDVLTTGARGSTWSRWPAWGDLAAKAKAYI